MAETEKPRDMFDTALQGLKPGLKVVGTIGEEVAKEAAPVAKRLTGEVIQKVVAKRRRRK